jgi:DNA (cytosine-5)-methyltransferase 1
MATQGFYEFFAGGGMARAGIGPDWECLFANDIDVKKASAYATNWGANTFHVGDVAKVTPTMLPGRADLVWASFPCQDLSLAGPGAGLSGKRSGTFWPFWHLMTELIDSGRKPRSIILENVCGLLTSRQGADFSALCDTLAASGFWVGALVIDAAQFLPHSRPRLFIIALDRDLPVAGRVQSAFAVDVWHPPRLRLAQAQLAEATRPAWLWFNPVVPSSRGMQLSEIVEENPQGVCWHEPPETQKLLDMMSAVNRAKVNLVVDNAKRAVGCIYKRTRIESGQKIQRAEVRFDVAGCLRTPGGGSSRQTLLVVKDGVIRTRLISPRETARLMGLPEGYTLPERYNDAYHVTGDGVAVPVVRHIVQHIIEPCLQIDQPMLQAVG